MVRKLDIDWSLARRLTPPKQSARRTQEWQQDRRLEDVLVHDVQDEHVVNGFVQAIAKKHGVLGNVVPSVHIYKYLGEQECPFPFIFYCAALENYQEEIQLGHISLRAAKKEIKKMAELGFSPGQIYVSEDLVKSMNLGDLAGITGHEVGHAVRPLRSVVTLEETRKYFLGLAASPVHQVEFGCDEIGADAAGANRMAMGLIAVAEKLLSGAKGVTHEDLKHKLRRDCNSTHPSSYERIEKLGFDPDVLVDEYFARGESRNKLREEWLAKMRAAKVETLAEMEGVLGGVEVEEDKEREV